MTDFTLEAVDPASGLPNANAPDGGRRPRRTAASAAELPPRLLSSAQVAEFIANGFLELDLPEVDPELHRLIHAKGKALHEKKLGAMGPGNNVYAAIPELRQVLAGPSCRGALTSVLGGGYATHAHRFMHVTRMGGDQSFHKDGQSGHGPVRHHRPRWAMILYCEC
eukprot:SAG22_NODE_5073_length_1092_cov_1.043303_2_plen_166_part_00